ncbi:TetR family transcriptional regulator [Kribbella orskensis]|uniref:TetR family transcriptional regulator n=1 Tax=Kribbella orskensis TaxID=2512216 RepID=A0ABY2BJN5_9ACTN|nr:MULTISPECIES: TetR/AcrR family transcriptional regulator [Kribbella]TCN40199.1 TetR family transcriptional regulator [Kribbella sp. VKM Ac-2500]TCO22819.1 TetR family transcriptional regulator [Kribbella orskensis]
MPAKTDHDARRRDVSAAVWRVLAAQGFGGLTLRAVAAELGATTGLVTHYFPSKQALIVHALEVAETHTRALVPSLEGVHGLEALRQALAAVLPLTPEGTEINRVWVSSWDAALADPELRALEKARYKRWRSRLKPLVIEAQNDGDLPTGDPDDLVAALAAFTHGLVVQALFDPRTFPRQRLLAVLGSHLEGLRP